MTYQPEHVCYYVVDFGFPIYYLYHVLTMINLLPSTDSLEKQHQHLLLFANQMALILDSPDVNKKSEEIFSLILKLKDKLELHLRYEDKTLYPYLIKSSNGHLRSMGENFFNELGALGKKFNAYERRWSSAAIIEENPVEFKNETEVTLKALINRIDKENNDLFPVIDHFITTRG